MHLCQPLDVSIFSPLKSYYKHIECRSRLGFSHIDKIDFLKDFLKAFLSARTEAYKSASIQNGFAATGLIPLDPDHVLGKLDIQLKAPTPPGSSHSNLPSSCLETPSNPHGLKRYSASVNRQLEPLISSPSNPIIARLNRLYKACEISMRNSALFAQEFAELRTAIAGDSQRRKRTKKVVIHENSLIGEESQSFLDESNAANQPRRRAPPKRSNCGIIGHDRRCSHYITSYIILYGSIHGNWASNVEYSERRRRRIDGVTE